ncbi:MAG TPA: RING finger protein [Planctomycetota bacterium]|nr:RING finger protein [Planctomycetota bacterium]
MYCGAELPKPVAAAAPPLTADPLALTPSHGAPSLPPPPGPPFFPERMKANKALLGRTCPSCSVAIELGDDVCNCQSCGSTMHQACREKAGACGHPACPSQPKLASAAAIGTVVSAPAGDTKECVSCGEQIQKKARVCRFCGEYQDPVDRERQKKLQAGADDDENLTGAEIAFGILCGGIACIMAIVWMVQGKKKGGKLLLISLVSQAVFTLIRLAAEGR